MSNFTYPISRRERQHRNDVLDSGERIHISHFDQGYADWGTPDDLAIARYVHENRQLPWNLNMINSRSRRNYNRVVLDIPEHRARFQMRHARRRARQRSNQFWEKHGFRSIH